MIILKLSLPSHLSVEKDAKIITDGTMATIN